MTRSLRRGVVWALVLVAAAVAAVWATAEPYQQDRVLVGLGIKGG